MNHPMLTRDERQAINAGGWFASLSSALRHDILRHAYVKRHRDGDLILARGDVANEWVACARGAVRVSSTSASGREIALAYIEPGAWFGDVPIICGVPYTHDAHAHGETTTLSVGKADLQEILAAHVELYEALLRSQARRIHRLSGLVEDLNTLPLRARLAKQLLHLVRRHGVPSRAKGEDVRIGLRLGQEKLAQLLGASRQRVNQELKAMERDNTIRIRPRGLDVRDCRALVRISETAR